MARHIHIRVSLVVLAGFSLLFSGCVSTSRTNVSMPDAGWMASLKRGFSGKPIYKTKIEEVPNREPGPNLYVAYGKLEEKRGDLPKAQEAYQTALKKNKKSFEAILGLARVDQLAGRMESAEQGFLRAKKLAPRSPVVLSALGQFYAKQGHWEEAIAAHRLAMQAAPVDKTYRYELARVLAQAGQTREALSHFEQTVGIAAAHYNIGIIAQEQGELDSSEQHFLKATIHDPAMQQAHEWLDAVRRQKAQQAREIAAKASSSDIQPVSAQQGAQRATDFRPSSPVRAAGHSIGRSHPPTPGDFFPRSAAPNAVPAIAPEQYLQRKNQSPAATKLGAQ